MKHQLLTYKLVHLEQTVRKSAAGQLLFQPVLFGGYGTAFSFAERQLPPEGSRPRLSCSLDRRKVQIVQDQKLSATALAYQVTEAAASWVWTGMLHLQPAGSKYLPDLSQDQQQTWKESTAFPLEVQIWLLSWKHLHRVGAEHWSGCEVRLDHPFWVR
mmetsp:Transcript_22165/g.39859  ORF Transcript_22165/g.39859 Transcript_22165/m.39859 type:complete len:158 (-) Transcript_22165:332-805(-)